MDLLRNINFMHVQKFSYLVFVGEVFEPSGCGLIDQNYVSLASSSKSELVAPVKGVFIGPSNLKS